MKNLPYLGALTAAWTRMNLDKRRKSAGVLPNEKPVHAPRWVLYWALFCTGALIGLLASGLARLLFR
jgi:hypothetical protein